MQEIPICLEGNKLLLKVPNINFALFMQEAIQESFHDLNFWLDWATHIPTLAECECRAANALEKFEKRTELPFYIFSKDENYFIGRIGLHHINWDIPKFEIGYWIRTSCQRQGYAAEAVKVITHFAFDKLHANRVEIRCDENNLRSKAIAQKLAFNLEGVLHNDTLTPDGRLRNTMVFAKISDNRQYK